VISGKKVPLLFDGIPNQAFDVQKAFQQAKNWDDTQLKAVHIASNLLKAARTDIPHKISLGLTTGPGGSGKSTIMLEKAAVLNY
jgi:putative protein kinase ArgK-like GTPase of G3E family